MCAGWQAEAVAEACADPWCRRLALETWNIASLARMEPELVQEVEQHQLHMVGLTSTLSAGSGTELWERG